MLSPSLSLASASLEVSVALGEELVSDLDSDPLDESESESVDEFTRTSTVGMAAIVFFVPFK